jgi:hypothetical protein
LTAQRRRLNSGSLLSTQRFGLFNILFAALIVRDFVVGDRVPFARKRVQGMKMPRCLFVCLLCEDFDEISMEFIDSFLLFTHS